MMLPVTDEEVTALDELLDARLREMRMEIAHTDDRAYRAWMASEIAWDLQRPGEPTGRARGGSRPGRRRARPLRDQGRGS